MNLPSTHDLTERSILMIRILLGNSFLDHFFNSLIRFSDKIHGYKLVHVIHCSGWDGQFFFSAIVVEELDNRVFDAFNIIAPAFLARSIAKSWISVRLRVLIVVKSLLPNKREIVLKFWRNSETAPQGVSPEFRPPKQITAPSFNRHGTRSLLRLQPGSSSPKMASEMD